MTKNQYTLEKINNDCIDEELFNESIRKASIIEKGSNGVGTLSEKTVHLVLKNYYVPDEKYHEINIVKKYVADACMEGEIYEIQSKSFYTMKDKLDCFLKEYEVTIVYPVAINKFIRYIDPETGEIYEKRKSTKKGGLLDIVPELYGIKDYLKNKKLHFIICFIEMEEYKILTDKLRIFFIELPKFHPKHIDRKNMLDVWMAFLNNPLNKEVEDIKEIHKALDTLKEISADREVREIYEMRKKTEMGYLSEKNVAVENARKEGKAEGEKLGAERERAKAEKEKAELQAKADEEKRESAVKMISDGLPAELVAKYSGLSIEEISEIRKKIQ